MLNETHMNNLAHLRGYDFLKLIWMIYNERIEKERKFTIQ